MAAAQLAFAQCLFFDGCIASFDAEKQRRPYHRNCGCALHGCARGGPKDPSCCARLPCPVRLGACGRGRLAVAAPVGSPSSVTTGGSRSWGGGATHGAAFESEDDGRCSLPSFPSKASHMDVELWLWQESIPDRGPFVVGR